MNTEALDRLLDTLRLDCAGLAARLGGRKEHYERLRSEPRMPFPVWDALQRLAHREGYVWDAQTGHWRKNPAPATAME